ncbi:MAG: 4Fe-4S binding protein [Coriobacteriaceae bacterium]|jgi:NAD-dependent dihydropyrimidine dehydrogenase PreA subunit|nr:4Fe-4S binding protein [Coriobacteriaceae bacterium]
MDTVSEEGSRTIIVIDEAACNGCGLCVKACHEGAIVLVDGKARLVNEHYCDGLGDCLPACPVGAITFEQRVAAAFVPSTPSKISSWPVQIKLVSPHAPCFPGSDILIAADCTAFASATFHQDLMAGRVTIIGCPKLDSTDYHVKLAEIVQANEVASVTVARMEVPCCGGIEQAARAALVKSGYHIYDGSGLGNASPYRETAGKAGKDLSFEVVTFATDGRLVKRVRQSATLL